MRSPSESPEDVGAPRSTADEKDGRRKAILEELERIVGSPSFRSAARSRQFLQFVVLRQLDGHSEQLKERTIGTEIFHRPPGYATGDDPVVRVQAGEVRRRLEHYYQTAPINSSVRIELPVGSYSPAFQWGAAASTDEKTHSNHPPTGTEPASASTGGRTPFRLWPWLIVAICFALALTAGAILMPLYRSQRQKSLENQFWGPVFASQQPVLICLAKPVVYRPSQEVYQRYIRSHPGTFASEVERTGQPLPLKQDQELSWGDFYVASDYGVAFGDVYAAVALSALLGEIGKPRQVRIGTNYSFEDLHNSPAVVVGAFNNKWTMQLMSNLRFTFVEEHEDFMIREASPGSRIWRVRTGPRGQTAEDFAIVSRLLNSKTGQFTVIVAGIGGVGTQAAGELVSNPKFLDESLRSAPVGWQTKNLEMVLETSVTDSVPGPAHVVASYVW